MPGPALSVYSPFIRCGMPQANSTTSSPRWMSPLLSGMVLPCSEDSSIAQAVEFLLHQFEELEQHARAPLRIGRGPGRLRRCRIGDGVFDLGLAGERDLGLHLAGIGIEHVAGAARKPPATSLPPMKWPIWRMDSLLIRIDLSLFASEIAQPERRRKVVEWAKARMAVGAV